MVNCEKCYKYHNLMITKECDFCRDYSFNENILCELLQAEHESYELECSAFKPNLSVIGKASKTNDVTETDGQKTNLTERHKWLKAYALQQWKSDESLTFADLNYHLCLLVNNRKRLLKNLINDVDKMLVILGKAEEQFEGKVNLLHIGEDHLHLHINSSPDYSADEVSQNIMTILEVEINSEFPEIFRNQEKIFQKTYFIETMG